MEEFLTYSEYKEGLTKQIIRELIAKKQRDISILRSKFLIFIQL